MTIRSKFRFWLLIIAIMAVVLFVSPAVSKTSLVDLIANWFAEYQEAVNEVEAEDDDEIAAGHETSLLVRIAEDIQAYSGIETQRLSQSEFYPESKATASVVDLMPMLTLRMNYQQLESEYSVLKVNERAAAQEKSRLQTLAKATKSVASKNLVYAESAWQEAKAKLTRVDSQLNALRDQANLLWGGELAPWLLANESPQWQRLVSSSDSLLLVTLPVERTLPSYVQKVRLALENDDGKPTEANYVSSAHQADNVLQGETYFFKVSDVGLRTGMRFDVWYPEQQQALLGVFIPEQAIVWTAGQAWIYVEMEEGLYQRRSLQKAMPAHKGMFLTDGGEVSINDQLVISGAQMLLSEEFRWQILDEDDD